MTPSIVIDDRRSLKGRGGVPAVAKNLKAAAIGRSDTVFLSTVSDNASVVAATFPPRVVRAADSLVSLVPTFRPLTTRGCHWMLVHDCRHIVEPSAFSAAQRLYRSAVLDSARLTRSHILLTSNATRDVLATRWPALAERAVVVRLATQPQAVSVAARSGPIDGLAFGHFANKRPVLAGTAWMHARKMSSALGTLHVVGVADEVVHRQLMRLDAGTGAIRVHPFLSEQEFESVRSATRIVVIPSTHEGFGLPVLEALARGQVPVVTPDAALIETADGNAIVARDDSADGVAVAVLEAATRADSDQHAIDRARAWAVSRTWMDVWTEIVAHVSGSVPGWHCGHCKAKAVSSRSSRTAS